jgi:Zn-finger nucleic acid-binding protein
MNCKNCGAGLQPVGNRSYFRCLHCETFHFPEEIGDGIAIVGDETSHRCPVCEESLIRAVIEGNEVGYCQDCRGFLANNRTFALIVQIKRARNDSAPDNPLPFSSDELSRRLKCPICSKLMETHPYHAGGNAVIDTCPRCHIVWLDSEELTVISRYRGKLESPVRSIDGDGSPVHPTPMPESETAFNLFGFRVKLT